MATLKEQYAEIIAEPVLSRSTTHPCPIQTGHI